MRSGTSIRQYLVVMVLAVTLPLAALGTYVVWSEVQASRDMADARVEDLAATTAQAIGQFVQDSEQVLAGLASRPAVEILSPEPCAGFIREANEVLQQFTNLFVVRANGDLVCSAIPPPEGRDSGADATWYAEASTKPGFNASKPQWGRISEAWISVFSVPVRSSVDGGELLGYVGASVELDRFRRLLRAARPGEAAVGTLAHVDRTVIARSDDDAWTGRTLPRVEGGSLHAERGRGVERAEGIDGIERLWGFATVPHSDWIVYAGVPTRQIYAGWRDEALSTGLSVVLLVLLLSLLAGRVYRRTTGALERLVEGAELAADRGVSHIPTEGPEEVVKVAQAFNRTLAERSRAEASLRRSTERYQSILHNTIFGIYVSTLDGRVLEANPAIARMLGYSDPEALLSLRMHRFYRNPGERERLVRKSLEAGESMVEEVEWIRKDGSPLHARLYVSRTEDLDGEVAFEVLVEDLTERRELEEQLRQSQKLEAVGTLAGGVAHDFNNRLTVIQGQAGMLLVDLPDESRSLENVEAILESALKASELTAQLLAFSRKQAIRPRIVDLNEVVAGMEGFLPRLMGEDVSVELSLDPGGAHVLADPRQIEQIILNLCTNSRDAMPDGGRLTIATGVRHGGREIRRPPGLGAGAYAVLTVADDGIGITEEVRARIFEPFFTTKPEGRGTGLGLSTVYGMVKQTGGAVEVESEAGAGTAFHLWLPLADGAPAETVAEVEAEGAPAEAGNGTRILVVEDEEGVRAVVVRTLSRAGYEVVEAGTGDEALEAVESMEAAPAAVVTDVVMPGMRGGELVERLTRRHPELRVLFISGYADEAPTELIQGEPGRDFLPKPFTPSELLKRLSELLERKVPARR